jgi:hypothetical protein
MTIRHIAEPRDVHEGGGLAYSVTADVSRDDGDWGGHTEEQYTLRIYHPYYIAQHEFDPRLGCFVPTGICGTYRTSFRGSLDDLRQMRDVINEAVANVGDCE